MKTNGFPIEVREAIAESQNYYCKHCFGVIIDYHHRLPNTASNRKLFPLFINSPFNCIGLCREAHETGIKEQYKITPKEAEVYEDFLRGLKVP